jgi:hypothetical protein
VTVHAPRRFGRAAHVSPASGEMLVELSVVGTFHQDDGDVRHVVRARLGWFRRKSRRRVTFASYE